MEIDPFVICLTSDLSSSSAAPRHTPPRFAVTGSFVPVLCLMVMAVLEEEDMVMLLPVGSRMVTSRLMSDVEITCEAEHEDSPF